MNKKTVLTIAFILIFIGVFKPNLNIFNNNNNVVDSIVVVSPPSNQKLKEVCAPVIQALKDGSNSRTRDGIRLSNLYLDIARLIELDGEDLVIKTTDEIRQANGLSGVMLRMDIKGKYPNLPQAAQSVILAGIGDDSVQLDEGLRAKAVESFRALGWACYEGSK